MATLSQRLYNFTTASGHFENFRTALHNLTRICSSVLSTQWPTNEKIHLQQGILRLSNVRGRQRMVQMALQQLLQQQAEVDSEARLSKLSNGHQRFVRQLWSYQGTKGKYLPVDSTEQEIILHQGLLIGQYVRCIMW